MIPRETEQGGVLQLEQEVNVDLTQHAQMTW